MYTPSLIPVFDGHNDLLLRLYRAGRDSEADFFAGTETGHIDMPRSRKGGFGGGGLGGFRGGFGQITITALSEGTTIRIVVKLSAQEVELVDLETDDDNGGGGGNQGNGDDGTKTCMIEGGKAGSSIELEGNVDSGTDVQFKLRVNGNRSGGLVDVAAAAASYKCNGDKASTDCKANLKPGAKVHVRGNLTTCTTTVASVTATQVTIQKD